MTQNRNLGDSNDSLLHDQIEKRAYEISQRHNGEPGHELEDWLTAEEEVKRDRPLYARMR